MAFYPVYCFTGDMYWRFDEENDRLNCPSDTKYPRDMAVWGGVRLPVSAAFTSFDGQFNYSIYSLICILLLN